MSWEDLVNEKTEDLVEFIRWGKQPEHKKLGEDAFIAFCFRFRERIQRTCRIIAEKAGYDDTVGDNIAETVFAKFFKYPNYNPLKCKSGDIDKCVELYLYKFAQRGLSDYNTGLKSPFSGDEEIVFDFPDIEDYSDVPIEKKAELEKKYEIIKNALERLSNKHKIIYLTYKQYDEELKDGMHYLPRALQEQLQNHLVLSQASIRKYKKEALDKINEYIEIYGSK